MKPEPAERHPATGDTENIRTCVEQVVEFFYKSAENTQYQNILKVYIQH